jgi:hypothetical protein
MGEDWYECTVACWRWGKSAAGDETGMADWRRGGKIMKEELEVGKECQMIMPSWAKKERMDVHGGGSKWECNFNKADMTGDE